MPSGAQIVDAIIIKGIGRTSNTHCLLVPFMKSSKSTTLYVSYHVTGWTLCAQFFFKAILVRLSAAKDSIFGNLNYHLKEGKLFNF